MSSNRWFSIAYLVLGVCAFVISNVLNIIIPSNLLYLMICIGISTNYLVLTGLERKQL